MRTSRALWYGLAGAAAAAFLLTPAEARAALLPMPRRPPPPEPEPEEDIAPPPARPGYAPDPLLGGGVAPPGTRPAPPAPSPLGPVRPAPDGTYPLVHGARYRAELLVDAPAFLVSESTVAAELTDAGFSVTRCMRTTGSHFLVEGTRTGPSGSFPPPERVTIQSLERLS